VPDAACSFICDSSAACALSNKIQHSSFGTGDANYQASGFVAMFTAERDSAFTIDQARDIRGIAYVEAEYSPVVRHPFSIVKNLQKKTPPGCPDGA
jgi:hypothetical protein